MDTTWIISLLLFLGVPTLGTITVVGMITSHKRRMLQLKINENLNSNGELIAEMQKLQSEVKALRSISVNYALSTEETMQKLENRMHHLETKMITSKHEEASVYRQII